MSANDVRMTDNRQPEFEKLPSGKTIVRSYDSDGQITSEIHSYGRLEIGLTIWFIDGKKSSESYFANRRTVSRKTYEARRVSYQDMPSANVGIEGFGADLLRGVRAQQRSNKAEAEERLKKSEESKYPRPKSTNWLRVIAREKAHLVEFASRDWKALSCGEFASGREWLRLFGFDGPPENKPCLHKGFQVGFEVSGNRETMLDVSKRLLAEVLEFAKKAPEPATWLYSFAPRPRKFKRKPILGWPTALPPLIEFLSGLNEVAVKIFNHHQ